MLNLEEIKFLIKNNNEVNRYFLSNERQVRRAISDLALEGIIFVPFDSSVYRRIDNLAKLDSNELDHVQKYIDKELKSAIKLIRRIRKLEKFMSYEQKKMLYGELV